MLLGILGTAHGPRVLAALSSLGGASRYTDIRNAARIGDAQVTRALKDLNKRGLAAGRPQPDGRMEYAITKLGAEVVKILGEFHAVVHNQQGSVAKATDKELEEILIA